jgi:hypothetical protein
MLEFRGSKEVVEFISRKLEEEYKKKKEGKEGEGIVNESGEKIKKEVE